MKIIKTILILTLALLFLPACGIPFFGIKIHTGNLKDAYANQAAMNPEGICTPQMLNTVWQDIKKWHYKPVTDKQLFSYGVKALGEAVGKSVDMPEKSHTFNDFWLLLDSIQRGSDKNLSETCYASLRGMIAGLKDPYASFFDAKEGKTRYGSMVGADYSGIGFTMIADYKKQRLFVDFVFEGSPADGQLKRFYEILAIGGRPIASLNLKKVVSHLRGKAGSKVSLILTSREKPLPRLVMFQRRKVTPKDARCSMVSGIPYCRVSGFRAFTVKYLLESFENLPSDHPKQIIFDLRNNPGGLLFSATNMASRFWIGKQDSMVLLKRQYGAVPFNDPTGESLWAGYKTVVLINKATASSSELIAAALRDHKKAIFIGQTTMGKGVSQRTRFVLGAVVSLTSMYFLSPHGHVTHGHGIKPNIPVKMTIKDIAAGMDPQLARAVKYMKGLK